MSEVPSRFWVVRKQGQTVMRFDTPGDRQVVPPEIEEHDAFTVHGVADRNGLKGTDIDHSVLTEEEREILGLPPDFSDQ